MLVGNDQRSQYDGNTDYLPIYQTHSSSVGNDQRSQYDGNPSLVALVFRCGYVGNDQRSQYDGNTTSQFTSASLSLWLSGTTREVSTMGTVNDSDDGEPPLTSRERPGKSV